MPRPSYILGISAFYHDSAAVLLRDGEIVAAAQEERFSRKKHDAAFPRQAVAWALAEEGIRGADVSVCAFYDKPWLKFERLLETCHAFAPRGLAGFLAAMPVWMRDKLFMRSLLAKELKGLGVSQAGLVFPEHHLSHAASAFFPSPFAKAAILTVDGVGEWATTTIASGDGAAITMRRELAFPHSLGLLYSAFTAWCGFRVNSGEYKLMGLAPYGQPDAAQTRRFEQIIEDELIDVREDGSFLLNMRYFDFATGLRMANARAWERLFGLPPRKSEAGDPAQPYMNLALAIQRVTEKVLLRLARTARDLTGCKELCLAGGVALNCVANGKLLESGLFRRIWVQPAAGDAGGALGAALAWWHIGLGQPRTPAPDDAMQGAYLGPAFSRADIARTCRRYAAPHRFFDDERDLLAAVADLLAAGKVVGWFQGRMEFGPRALGHRSILADARSPAMQKRLNLAVKHREGFRPFAPAVRAEEAAQFFDLAGASPYMLFTCQVKDRRPLPPGYHDWPLWERLYFIRSDLPAITHVDGSARVQTVSKMANPRFWNLLACFSQRHGSGVLVNTSFNVRGEPIVCTPEEAYLCFMRTGMDALVLGEALLLKDGQPPLPADAPAPAHALD